MSIDFAAPDRHNSIVRPHLILAVLMTLIACAHPTAAETIVLRNDAATPASPGSIQLGFAAGDVAASIFELPPGVQAFKINTVQALIMSNPSDGVPTMVDVQLYCGTPGSAPPAAVIQGATMVPDWLNLLNVSEDGWIVRSGSPFAIGLRYNWGVEGIDAFNGHITADADGCQPGKNRVYNAAMDSWVDPSSIGAPGDFIIRVEGEPIPTKAPFGDFDGNGFADMLDFAELQRCLTRPEAAPPSAECLAAFDCDDSGRVDVPDVLQFVTCARGPAVPIDPNCGDCLPGGFCDSVATLKPIEVNDGHVETLTWQWHGVPVLAPLGLVDGGWNVARGWLNETMLRANIFSWKVYAQGPNSTERQFVKNAADYLRDVWGATDDEARQCGLALGNSQWYTQFFFVIQGHNPRAFIAHNPVGAADNNKIYLDRQYVSTLYSTTGLALILYAEWSHMQYGPGEKLAQEKLNQFRQRHNAQHILPRLKHGATDFGN